MCERMRERGEKEKERYTEQLLKLKINEGKFKCKKIVFESGPLSYTILWNPIYFEVGSIFL